MSLNRELGRGVQLASTTWLLWPGAGEQVGNTMGPVEPKPSLTWPVRRKVGFLLIPDLGLPTLCSSLLMLKSPPDLPDRISQRVKERKGS